MTRLIQLLNKYYNEECDLTQFSNAELSMFEKEVESLHSDIVYLKTLRTLFTTYQG